MYQYAEGAEKPVAMSASRAAVEGGIARMRALPALGPGKKPNLNAALQEVPFDTALLMRFANEEQLCARPSGV